MSWMPDWVKLSNAGGQRPGPLKREHLVNDANRKKYQEWYEREIAHQTLDLPTYMVKTCTQSS